MSKEKSNAIEYTVYVNIEAYDESKLRTAEDDCWYPSNEKNLFVTNNLAKAEKFVRELPVLDDDLKANK